ncbi:MAG: patatin-like phospholipase family protein [Turicibacter sp.]|nr:patatin-like phospholipase family protein [Turicibacter sp.]
MKRGLALEGGGARGAYHIGVVKAYRENGYEFDGYVGTSIGAVNAAILAQGDFEKAKELWQKISLEQLFNIDDQLLLTISEAKLNKDTAINLGRSLKRLFTGGGFDTSKMKKYLSSYLDEDKIRKSGKDFGLVTYSLDERKPYEVHLEDIVEGKLISYIMASASLPFFKSEVIDEKKFIDGGVYNNCPVTLLAEKKYDEIIAVRLGNFGIIRKVKGNAKVTVITPRDDLGDLLHFDPDNSKFHLELGYYDGLRAIKNLRGFHYYLEPVKLDDIYNRLIGMDDSFILELGEILDVKELPPKRVLFEEIIPQIGAYLKLKKDFDYADFLIGLLEEVALKKDISRFAVYSFESFIRLIKKTPDKKTEESLIEKVINLSFSHKKNLVADKLVHFLLTGL